MWVDRAGVYWRQEEDTSGGGYGPNLVWEYLHNNQWLPGTPGPGLLPTDDIEGVVVRVVLDGKEDVIRLGPQGDTGPQGPQGDLGPRGPQGEALAFYVSISTDYTIELPDDPTDHQMAIYEIRASAPATVLIPSEATLTTNTRTAYVLRAETTGFFGFRYSASASTWFLMSATMQV